jgi:hypothetical protein
MMNDEGTLHCHRSTRSGNLYEDIEQNTADDCQTCTAVGG